MPGSSTSTCRRHRSEDRPAHPLAEVHAARDELLAKAAHEGRRLTVAELAEHLGKRLTFYFRVPEVAAEIVNVATEAGHKATGRPRNNRAAELETKLTLLRRERADLRRHLDIYAGHIRRLTMERAALRQARESHVGVTIRPSDALPSDCSAGPQLAEVGRANKSDTADQCSQERADTVRAELLRSRRSHSHPTGGPHIVTLRQELDDLTDLKNGITPQTRGRKFERWLRELLSEGNLEPRTAYRPKGEEIDGSFVHRDRTYLLEAKWLADEVPASTIYQFKGKVDGKLVGTIGVFISMSGFSTDSVEALRVGKELNIILFDRRDIEAALAYGFATVLAFKLRAAADQGDLFIPYISPVERGIATIVVEGRSDEIVVRMVAETLRKSGIEVRELEVIVAQGAMGLAPIAATALQARGGDVLAIADSDGFRTEIPHPEAIEGKSIEVIIVEPAIEIWMGYTKGSGKRIAPADLRRRAAAIDIAELSARDEGFSRLVRFLKA
ncbi:restriction endonuclease [Kitasatospora sp. NPDC052868]|uniref:restriction endonuclease n=1 Tax=Kitasatospora sp. NPDC052868 TaxID=3364060 RepID=UPI0037CC21EE